MHILRFVKQNDVTRHFSLTRNLLIKKTQRKFHVHVICIRILVYVQILISATLIGRSDRGLQRIISTILLHRDMKINHILESTSLLFVINSTRS